MSIKKTFVISLGGSLIVPQEGVDWKFLKKFYEFIKNQLMCGNKFFIITGGGRTCRNYIEAAEKITNFSDKELDWLGIHTSHLNAQFLRMIFGKLAHEKIVTDPTARIKTSKKIIIGGGWKPGWSTDYVATVMAERHKVNTLINLSNIDYAYDKDPSKYDDAKKIREIDWAGFREIVGSKWIPGLSAPFDPIATRKAEEIGLKVIIINGRKLANLEKCLQGRKFSGTVIS